MKRGSHHCWSLAWADDLVYGSTDETFTGWFETEMGKKFTNGDCGDLTCFLGTTAGTTAPLVERLTLSKDDPPLVGSDDEDGEKQTRHLDYRGLMGRISYLAHTTRPDLAFSAHLLPSFRNNPREAHWKAAKHVLRYLKGT